MITVVVLVCLLVTVGCGGSIGLGTVWMRHQISLTANSNRFLATHLTEVERQIQALTGRLDEANHLRNHALEIGVDPDTTVDEFCRLFPNGDRRVVRVVRQQAALVGHDLRWKDDLVGSITDEKRSAPPSQAHDLPAIAFTKTGRLVAAVLDLSAAVGTSAAIAKVVPIRWSVSLAVGVLAYHTISLIALGSTPAVWAIETYLTNRHPTTTRSASLRFLRLLHRSETSNQL